MLGLVALSALGIGIISLFVMTILIWRQNHLNSQSHSQATVKLDTFLQQIEILKQQLSQQVLEQAKSELNQKMAMEQQHHEAKQLLNEQYHGLQQLFAKNQIEQLKAIQESVLQHMQDIRAQLQQTLAHNTTTLNEKMHSLTQQTNQQLQEISGQVEKRLAEGFEKTSEVFIKIVERLTIIDQAQQKITELSSNVVNLQEILADKRSRGAFGEVQLNSLIHNMLPSESFALQHTLSNSKRVDCLLKLPEPTGNVAIDAKFPLETFRLLQNEPPTSSQRKTYETQFKQDIRKHIKDIAEKYIVEGETAEGAIMFIPSESIFAEIHGHYGELVEFAHQQRVWLASPTTMMAILTTAKAVLKDTATRKQVHIIQEHLRFLGEDFNRFQKRMDALAKHIELANKDVSDVQTSAKKISSRFNKIETVRLEEAPDEVLTLLEETSE